MIEGGGGSELHLDFLAFCRSSCGDNLVVCICIQLDVLERGD